MVAKLFAEHPQSPPSLAKRLHNLGLAEFVRESSLHPVFAVEMHDRFYDALLAAARLALRPLLEGRKTVRKAAKRPPRRRQTLDEMAIGDEIVNQAADILIREVSNFERSDQGAAPVFFLALPSGDSIHRVADGDEGTPPVFPAYFLAPADDRRRALARHALFTNPGQARGRDSTHLAIRERPDRDARILEEQGERGAGEDQGRGEGGRQKLGGVGGAFPPPSPVQRSGRLADVSAEQTTPAEISADDGLRCRPAAAFLSVSPSTLYRWSSQGLVPATRLGRALVFRRRDLIEILERGIPAARRRHAGDCGAVMADPISANLTLGDPQKVRNLFVSGLRVIDSPTSSRDSERTVLLAHVDRVQAILREGASDGA
jgi:helix-turn-helix protein